MNFARVTRASRKALEVPDHEEKEDIQNQSQSIKTRASATINKTKL